MSAAPHQDDGRSLEMLQQAFIHLGAAAEPARVMAAQLLKRARQLAADRGIAEAAALSELLAKVVAGRQGEYTGQPPISSAGDGSSSGPTRSDHPTG